MDDPQKMNLICFFLVLVVGFVSQCVAIDRNSFPVGFQLGFNTSAYQQDIQILKNLGTDVYRFSISWPRVFPRGSTRHGEVNLKGVQYNNSLINELIENGIDPIATIFHWDVPQVLEDEYGGFRSNKILNDFSEFAEFCFKAFGDRVKTWVTVTSIQVDLESKKVVVIGDILPFEVLRVFLRSRMQSYGHLLLLKMNQNNQTKSIKLMWSAFA